MATIKHYAETGQSDGGNESGRSVQPLQRMSRAQFVGKSLTKGMYIQEIIATVREKRRLGI